jgi:probable HAF family extracellular repeat protein
MGGEMKTSISLLAFRSFLLLLLAACALLLPNSAAADPLYTVIGLGGLNSHAYGINNLGEVVGAFAVTDDAYRQILPFLWENGTFIQLPTQFDSPSRRGAAFAISDDGYIAGIEGDPRSYFHGAIWQDGQFEQWVIGGDFSKLTDINDAGQAVGYAIHPGGDYWGVCVGCLQGDSGYGVGLSGINNAGDIAGDTFVFPGGVPGAVVFDDRGTATQLFPNAGNTPSMALAINNKGDVAGSNDGNAFLLDGGRYINLGFSIPVVKEPSITFTGNPLAMNDWGEVVSGQYIWYGGQLYNVNDLLPTNSGWTITEVNGVNNWGQIVGTGIYNGQTEAFIANPVPEPGSITLLLAGLTMTLMLLHKKVWA